VELVISCDCGYVIRAHNHDEAVAKAREHIQSDHPDWKVSDDDLAAMIEEV
jgi:predicted small metal-binding protein